MIYASPEFAFRQRLNQLNQNTNPAFSSLNIPFGSIFRDGNWGKENKVGVVYAPGVLGSVTMNDGCIIRFINTQTNFDLMLFFGREDDAQIAYETLMWIKYPNKKLLQLTGLEYKGRPIDIPLSISVTDVDYASQYKEQKWIDEQRLIPIHANIEITSAILDQYAQGPDSSLFTTYPGDGQYENVILTEKVILDFLSYHGNNQYVDEDGILLEVISTVAPDPDLLGEFVFESDNIKDDEIDLSWSYNEGEGVDIPSLYETNVRISCSNGTSVEVPLTDKAYTYGGLEPDSYYDFSIFFISKAGMVTKYSLADCYTTLAAAPPNLKGMIGLTW